MSYVNSREINKHIRREPVPKIENPMRKNRFSVSTKLSERKSKRKNEIRGVVGGDRWCKSRMRVSKRRINFKMLGLFLG
jgi:hypothetical protein